MKKQELIHLRELVHEVGKYVEGDENFQDLDASEMSPETAFWKSKTENRKLLFSHLNKITENIPENIREKTSARGRSKSGSAEELLESRGKEQILFENLDSGPDDVRDPYFWGEEAEDFEKEVGEISTLLDEIEQVQNFSEDILRNDDVGKKEYDSFMNQGDPPESRRLPNVCRGISRPHLHESYPEEVEEVIKEELDDFDTAEEFRDYVHGLNEEASILPLRSVPGQGTELRQKYADVVWYGHQNSDGQVLEMGEDTFIAFDAGDWLEEYQLGSGSSVTQLYQNGYLGVYGKEGQIPNVEGIVLDHDGIIEIIGQSYADSMESEVEGVAD